MSNVIHLPPQGTVTVVSARALAEALRTNHEQETKSMTTTKTPKTPARKATIKLVEGGAPAAKTPRSGAAMSLKICRTAETAAPALDADRQALDAACAALDQSAAEALLDAGQVEAGVASEPAPSIELTQASRTLFMALWNDAGNWSGTPLFGGNVGGSKADRGNLTDLKRKGLLTTTQDEDNPACQWVTFTPLGEAYAAETAEGREATWDKFVMGAPRPRTPSEQQYSDRKLRSRN